MTDDRAMALLSLKVLVNRLELGEGGIVVGWDPVQGVRVDPTPKVACLARPNLAAVREEIQRLVGVVFA
jgi:hypothetical protein